MVWTEVGILDFMFFVKLVISMQASVLSVVFLTTLFNLGFGFKWIPCPAFDKTPRKNDAIIIA